MTTTGPSDPGARIQALDALRGFALCGIVFINIYQTLHLRDLPLPLGLFVLGRFFVIFSLLFGIGFGIFLDRAAARSERPRLLLVRRLVVLAGFGALHHLLQPSEVLLWYAGFGLLVLLPFSYAPRRANLVVGLVLLAVGTAMIGGVGLIPGLFLLGLALSSYRVPQTLPQRTRSLALLFGTFALLSAALYAVLASGAVADPRAIGGRVLAVLMSFGYMTGFLLLLRSPLAGPLSALFVPLGRMALTNYLTATVIFVPVGLALGLEGSRRWGAAIALGFGILVVQAIASPLWLRTFRYGPLEWVWRCATWGQRVPIRREERDALVA